MGKIHSISEKSSNQREKWLASRNDDIKKR